MNSAKVMLGKLESLRRVDKFYFSGQIAARLTARGEPSAIHARILVLTLVTGKLFFHFEVTDSEIYTVC